MSGYWVRKDDKNELLFFSREGMLNSSKEIDGSLFYFIGRWQVVQELKPARPDVHSILVMATDEKLCDQAIGEQTPNFRILEHRHDGPRDNFLTIDASIQDPPPEATKLPARDLWAAFSESARDAKYKFEGYWYKIDESAAPPWFRDQVKHLVHSGRFACEEPPAKK
ncbi:MAG: hypothetical protein HQL45_16875 [Alphaproteobacteria bacterium]|nr:hypothetical protein [Alphaproteobacteria bacterium]